MPGPSISWAVAQGGSCRGPSGGTWGSGRGPCDRTSGAILRFRVMQGVRRKRSGSVCARLEPLCLPQLALARVVRPELRTLALLRGVHPCRQSHVHSPRNVTDSRDACHGHVTVHAESDETRVHKYRGSDATHKLSRTLICNSLCCARQRFGRTTLKPKNLDCKRRWTARTGTSIWCKYLAGAHYPVNMYISILLALCTTRILLNLIA